MFQHTYKEAAKTLKQALRPGASTLGLWLGWNQPEEPTQKIKLGPAYAQAQEFTLRDVMKDTELGYQLAAQILRNRGPNVTLDEPMGYGNLIRAEEVFVPFNVLDNEERALVRLSLVVVNTMGEAHEWSIGYREMLAHRYVCHEEAEVSEWALHNRREWKEPDLAEELLYWLGERIPKTMLNRYSPPLPEPSPEAAEWEDKHNLAEILFPDGGWTSPDVHQITAFILGWIKDKYLPAVDRAHATDTINKHNARPAH